MSGQGAEFDQVYRNYGKALVIPVEPIVGEGPADFLLRAAAINGFARPDLLLSFLRKSARVPRLNSRSILSSCVESAKIATLTGVRPTNGCISTLFPDVGKARRLGYVNLLGAEVRATEVVTVRRVAPRSLVRSAHQKAVWSLRLFNFDIETGERLLESCPVCGKKLGFRYTSGVEFCEHCARGGVKTDIRNHIQPLAEIRDPEALRFVASLIDASLGKDAPIPSIDERLSRFGRGELFHLSASIARAVARVRRFQACDSGRYIEPVIGEIEEAGRALINWPDGVKRLSAELVTALDRTKALATLLPGNGGFLDFAIRGSPLASDLKTLLREAQGSSYVAKDRPPPSLLPGSSSGTHSTAAPIWGSSVPDHINRRNCSDQSPDHPTRDLGAAAKLLARSIGVPTIFLPSIAACCRPVPPPPCLADATELTEGATGLFDLLRCATKPKDRRAEMLSVNEVVASISTANPNPWPTLFRTLIRGAVPCLLLPPAYGSLIRRLQVDVDGAAILKEEAERTGPNNDDDILISDEEASMMLAVHPRYIQSIRKSKLAFGKASLKRVQDFKRQYMFTPHAVTMMKILKSPMGTNAVKALRSRGAQSIRIHEVLLWERNHVETLCHAS